MGLPRIERVEWLDTGMSITDGWMSEEKLRERADPKRMEAISVGWFLYETDDVLVLTQTYDEALDQHFNAQVIHKTAITSRRTINA